VDWITDYQSWIALFTLVALELVLGVDNVIFISILSGKLPHEEQPRARTIGIITAVFTRILLLSFLYAIINLTSPLFTIPGVEIEMTGKSLVLFAGGLFLLWKSTHEIHEKLEGEQGHASAKITASFVGVVIQIGLLDIVFSLDSVITAIGMADEIAIMVIAVIIAAFVMIFIAGLISDFVDRHPTIKMLALSFLIMIGFTLVAGAFHYEIPKGYIYFAMAFSVMVEMLNLRVRGQADPVNLRNAYTPGKKPELQPLPVAVEPKIASEMPVKSEDKPMPPSKPKRKVTSKTSLKAKRQTKAKPKAKPKPKKKK